MKKMDKKGFTLIELLAVIVILAIIMVIAVPKILNVIDNSRKSAWKSNIKMIEEGLELGKTLSDSNLSEKTFDISSICTGAEHITETEVTDNIADVVDISKDDTKVFCAATKGAVTVSPAGTNEVPKGQFKSQSAITITCSDGSCSDNWETVYNK